jgi:hypothetical protein
LHDKLRSGYPSASDSDIDGASHETSLVAEKLVNIPLCESAGVGVGHALKLGSESIAQRFHLDADNVVDILLETVRRFSRRDLD